MVTGDHPVTAKAIAERVNILKGKTRGDVAAARGVSEAEVSRDDPEVNRCVYPSIVDWLELSTYQLGCHAVLSWLVTS